MSYKILFKETRDRWKRDFPGLKLYIARMTNESEPRGFLRDTLYRIGWKLGPHEQHITVTPGDLERIAYMVEVIKVLEDGLQRYAVLHLIRVYGNETKYNQGRP